MTKRKSKKERLKIAMGIADEALSDGAYWQMVHEIANLEYGDAFEIISNDPEYFEAEEVSHD